MFDLAAAGQAMQAFEPLMVGLFIFALAIFLGYELITKVPPTLHTPLMSVTNAISSVIIVGALIAAGPMEIHFSKIMGFIAVVLASINIFGVTHINLLRVFNTSENIDMPTMHSR